MILLKDKIYYNLIKKLLIYKKKLYKNENYIYRKKIY